MVQYPHCGSIVNQIKATSFRALSGAVLLSTKGYFLFNLIPRILSLIPLSLPMAVTTTIPMPPLHPLLIILQKKPSSDHIVYCPHPSNNTSFGHVLHLPHLGPLALRVGSGPGHVLLDLYQASLNNQQLYHKN